MTGLTASPDGATVAASARDGGLRIVDVASGQVTELAASRYGQIDGLSWSPGLGLAGLVRAGRSLARIRMAGSWARRGVWGIRVSSPRVSTTPRSLT